MPTATSDRKAASNRANAARSTGPKSAEGKEKIRLNALKHGLRAKDIVLPSEDADDFEAFRLAWHDDWKPCTQARFQLVEALAVDAWRLRRCVRLETLRLAEAGRRAVAAYDDEVRARVADGLKRLGGLHPERGLEILEADREGLEAQRNLWLDLADSAGRAEEWNDTIDQHTWIPNLRGLPPSTAPEAVGPEAVLSWRLLVYNGVEEGDPFGDPLDEVGAALVFAELIASLRDRAEALRLRLDEFLEPEVVRARISDMALAEDTPEARMALRYEGQHNRSFRANLNLLMKLVQTGSDLVEQDQPVVETEVMTETPPPAPAAPIKANEPTPVSLPAPIKANESVPDRPEPPSKPRRKGRDRRENGSGRGPRPQPAL